jgi:glycosyltransferase involved in cell wall biosynthesis
MAHQDGAAVAGYAKRGSSMTPTFVLVTAAYNEERFIEQTILSMVAQTRRPSEWIIVSDASTDATDRIVEKYSALHPFIRLVRITEDHPRNFAAQVLAINTGIRNLTVRDFQYFGNVDADITFDPEYFSLLLEEFAANLHLGLGGGYIRERAADGQFVNRKRNSVRSVAHACQMFRRECLEAVGGCYVPLPYGAPDVYAEVAARMQGWEVKSFPHLPVYHHRFTGSADRWLKNGIRQGKADYSLGTLPMFEIVRTIRRCRDKPFVLGSLARLAGFGHSYWIREPRAVPREFLEYLRKEQSQRLARIFSEL